MTFQNDDGEVLDFDGKFAITRRAVSFLNSKIQGDFSVNFEVDNNSVNRKVLGYDGPQMRNQVAFTRQSFTLIRNGNPFMKGFIVIQSDNGATLSCFFMSGNSNWLNMVQGLITELDYTGVTNGVNYQTYFDQATIEGSFSATSGIIFPMVDWAYNFRKGTNYWFALNLLDVSVQGTTADFLRDAQPESSFSEWYPCLYLHTLISEIVKQNGLKIDGNLLDNKIYKSIVLTPRNGQMKRPDVKITTAYSTGTQVFSSGSLTKYTAFNTIGSNPEGLFSTSTDTYTANRTAKLSVIITVSDYAEAGGATSATLAIRKNGTQYWPVLLAVAANSTNGVYKASIPVVSGDLIDFAVSRSPAGTVTLSLDVKFDIPTQVTINDYILPNYFLPELSCLEVLKSAFNLLGCTVNYNEYSKTITANIIESLKEENAQDLSDYFVSASFDYAQGASNNYIRIGSGDDQSVNSYNKSNFKKYGEGNIQTSNTLNENANFAQIPFSASEFGYTSDTQGNWLTHIPLVKLVDNLPIAYTSITDNAGIALFTLDGTYNFNRLMLARIVDDNIGDMGIRVILEFSATNELQFYDTPFVQDGTGKIYLQTIQFNEVKPRLLLVKPQTTFTDFAALSSSFKINGGSGENTHTSAPFAHYSKPQIGLSIDAYKSNLAFDNPDIDLFEDPALRQLYFSKIGRMIGNPVITATFLLPESVFQSFDFQSFIYLKTKDLTGYFWVDSIINYQDGATPVEVKLLML